MPHLSALLATLIGTNICLGKNESNCSFAAEMALDAKTTWDNRDFIGNNICFTRIL